MGDFIDLDKPLPAPVDPSKLKQLHDTAAKVIKGVVKGEPILASPETKEIRLALCAGCEFFTKDSGRCTKCGCFMNIKTKLANVHCPLKKW